MFVNNLFTSLTCTYLKKEKSVSMCDVFNILFSNEDKNIDIFSNLYQCTFKLTSTSRNANCFTGLKRKFNTRIKFIKTFQKSYVLPYHASIYRKYHLRIIYIYINFYQHNSFPTSKENVGILRMQTLTLWENKLLFTLGIKGYLKCVDAVLTLIIKCLFLFGKNKLQKVLPCSLLCWQIFNKETETTCLE